MTYEWLERYNAYLKAPGAIKIVGTPVTVGTEGIITFRDRLLPETYDFIKDNA